MTPDEVTDRLEGMSRQQRDHIAAHWVKYFQLRYETGSPKRREAAEKATLDMIGERVKANREARRAA